MPRAAIQWKSEIVLGLSCARCLFVHTQIVDTEAVRFQILTCARRLFLRTQIRPGFVVDSEAVRFRSLPPVKPLVHPHAIED